VRLEHRLVVEEKARMEVDRIREGRFPLELILTKLKEPLEFQLLASSLALALFSSTQVRPKLIINFA